MRYEYKTENTCSQVISFDIEGNLLGNLCGRRPTSCTDQLAKAVREAYNKFAEDSGEAVS